MVKNKKTQLKQKQIHQYDQEKVSRTDPHSEQIMAQKHSVAIDRLFQKLNLKQEA